VCVFLVVVAVAWPYIMLHFDKNDRIEMTGESFKLSEDTALFSNVSPLGVGGYAVVLSGVHRGAPSAVKIAKPGSHITRDAILKEAGLLKILKHRHVVDLVAVLYLNVVRDGKAVHVGALVMPQLETLRSMMPLRNEVHASGLTMGLYNALEHLERHGIIHGDPKPDNVLYNGKDFVLGDFGMSKKLSEDGHIYDLFTLWYRPPEILLRFKGKKQTADMWAVGLTIMEGVLGEPIFPEMTDTNMIYAIHLVLGMGDLCSRSEWPSVRSTTLANLTDVALSIRPLLHTACDGIIGRVWEAARQVGPCTSSMLEIVYDRTVLTNPDDRASPREILDLLEAIENPLK
jgi:serine/threonine protein kinase